MSKENANLRLLGSPVNLSYRNKKKEDRKNTRNRPRSAVNNSCVTQETQEKLKRPFSADTKDRAPTTRSFFKAFSDELLQSYNNSPLKIVAPTLEILGEPHNTESRILRKDKEICSNASDYGSEDTFISLGTKIKARAQLSPKPKITNPKNILKYRNIARKSRRPMANSVDEEFKQDYGMEVKITERSPSPTKTKNVYDNSLPSSRRYETYFVPLEDHGDLGRITFNSNIDTEIEQALDNYSRRVPTSKQQLSLVEEESPQDVDSGPSQNLSSLSPENSLEDPKNNGDIDDLTGRKTYVVDDIKTDYGTSQSKVREPRTYTHFYDDIQTDPYKCKLSSTIVHTDSSSKDSGYPDSGPNEEKFYRQNYSLPATSLLEKANVTKIEDQPKSLDSLSTNSSDKTYRDVNSFVKNKQWTGPLNHSRLLYKDFFLKKEGHIAVPPQNSPNKGEGNFVQETSADANIKSENISDDSNYPSYLVNSTTKAYTSKVIEDYKRELETINNLHELTLKDIKADAISPTPLNIDKMFDEQPNSIDITQEEHSIICHESKSDDRNTNSMDAKKRDVSKISTKELIQNYFKVKEGDFKGNIPKNTRKKTNNITLKDEIVTYKQEWNNKTTINSPKNISVIRNQTQKNVFTMRTPLSARIESVQNDQDIDSWMSLSAPSPTMLDIEKISTPIEAVMETDVNLVDAKFEDSTGDSSPPIVTSTENENKQIKELSNNSTVFDIYSMLKEIESYGDNPVTSIAKVDTANDRAPTEERSPTPKDNFMEIFEFLEKVEQSANDALSVVTNTTPQSIPKLEGLLKLPQTELAQRLVTASLQLEERSCCIALLQESLANHKEQMIQKVSNLEKQSQRNISKVKQECEETIKRHQNFIDQLINDKKTLNHRIEQLVDERRSAEERWKRSAQVLEDRYKLELRNQHDKMAAAQQVARQRWVRQKAEKIKVKTWKREQEKMLQEVRTQLDTDIASEKAKLEEQMKQREKELEQKFEQYKKEYEAEQQVILKKKVTEISAQHKQERDKEIERAIESMEAEAQAGRKELQDALRRNKEQYEVELKELAETEQATLRRYQEAQARVRQTEDRCAELEVTISQLETRNRVLTEKNTQLESRAVEVRAACEQTWRATVDGLNKQMEDLKKTHEEQMHQLYAKVKVAVARKDSAIQALTRETAKYQEKITILEQKLQQQRKDFLKQK